MRASARVLGRGHRLLGGRHGAIITRTGVVVTTGTWRHAALCAHLRVDLGQTLCGLPQLAGAREGGTEAGAGLVDLLHGAAFLGVGAVECLGEAGDGVLGLGDDAVPGLGQVDGDADLRQVGQSQFDGVLPAEGTEPDAGVEGVPSQP